MTIQFARSGVPRTLRRTTICMLVVVMGLHAHPTAQARDSEPALLPPIERFQAAIAALAEAKNQAAVSDAIDHYVALAPEDTHELARQALWYRSANEHKAGSQAVVGRIFKRLERDKKSLIAALVRLLDDDVSLQRYAQDALRGYEDRSALRPPDYSIYHTILEDDFRASGMPQPSLVKFMYEGDPGVALLTIMRASQMRDPAEMKPILWAEHVVADLRWRRQFGFVEAKAVDSAVVRELDKLSQHTAWWARLYVAEMIRQHPELGTKTIRERLAADSHELVRKSSAPAAPAK